MTIAYLVPFLPVVSRLALTLRFRKKMGTALTPAEADRSEHRSFIFSWAGFSFTALLALIVLDAATQSSLELSIYYLFLSFLSFLWSLNLQSYKARRWHSEFALALMDVGVLSLLLSILALLWIGKSGSEFARALTCAGLGIWLLDHVLRLSVEYGILRKERND